MRTFSRGGERTGRAGGARADTYVDANAMIRPPGPSGAATTIPEPSLVVRGKRACATRSGIGIGIAVGGGVNGFTDKTMRDATSSVGGGWNARVSFGTHLPLAIEAMYNGTATDINSLLGPGSATLLGTAFEGDVRFNLMPHFMFDPYVFVGAGWQHYSIENNNAFSLSDTGIAQSDDLLSIPMGVGLSYRSSGFVAEARGTFRATTDSNLVLENPGASNAEFAKMHSWDANLNVGYEW